VITKTGRQASRKQTTKTGFKPVLQLEAKIVLAMFEQEIHILMLKKLL
jgi:hypothetical protein